MIDFPGGWRYGFPKAIPWQYLKSKTLMKIWLMSQKYPSEDIDFAMRYYRTWQTSESKENTNAQNNS